MFLSINSLPSRLRSLPRDSEFDRSVTFPRTLRHAQKHPVVRKKSARGWGRLRSGGSLRFRHSSQSIDAEIEKHLCASHGSSVSDSRFLSASVLRELRASVVNPSWVAAPPRCATHSRLAGFHDRLFLQTLQIARNGGDGQRETRGQRGRFLVWCRPMARLARVVAVDVAESAAFWREK